jgi:chemotaxis protein MotB
MNKIFKSYIYVAEENPLWLIGLGNIMTTLMLFFLVLYVFSAQGKNIEDDFVSGLEYKRTEDKRKEEKGQEIIKKIKEEEAAENITQKLNEAGLSEMSEVTMTSKMIRINLSAPILFKSGSDELNPEARTILKPIGYLLKNLENNKIIVEGHTDSVPIKTGKWKTNWELSAARANSVVDFFNEEINIPNEKMVAAAFGEYRPVASNKTAEGRAKNRRIEIVVMRENE